METPHGPILIVYALIALAIFALLRALTLMLANRMVNGFTPGYGRAYGVEILTTAIVALIVRGIQWAMHFDPKSVTSIDSQMLMFTGIQLVLEIIVGAAFLNWLVRRPDGSPLGYGKSVPAYVIQAIFWGVIALGLAAMAFHFKAMHAGQ